MAENRGFVDQLPATVGTFIAVHRDVLSLRGSIVESWRSRNGRRFGPYHRLTVRDVNGRQRSVYLGGDAEVVDQVRKVLVELQRARRTRRTIQDAGRSLRRAFAEERAAIDAVLEQSSFRRKGSEFRRRRRAASNESCVALERRTEKDHVK
jgi:hypothetical protein